MGRIDSMVRRFPAFYRSSDPENVLNRFLRTFGETLDAGENDLIAVLHSHWVNSADNADSQGFDTAHKGDLDKIFSLYIENLGGTSQLKQMGRRDGADGAIDDAAYLKRIKGLISILKNGASTREGITAIIAANLGIVGDDAAATSARELIRIVEFMPEPQTAATYHVKFQQEFIVLNPNAIETTPEVRMLVRPDFPMPLIDAKLCNLTNGDFARYRGSLAPGDVLSLFSNYTASLNGIRTPVEGCTPRLPPGESRWCLDGSVGLVPGQFDLSRMEFSLFDRTPNGGAIFALPTSQFSEFGFAYPYPVIDVDVTLVKLTPASFMVRIPWDIPGFTERFDELPDNPRHQIQYIVNKVKAAGVFAVISYEKRFTEEQEMRDLLTVRMPLPEDHAMVEANFDIGSIQRPYQGGLAHELSDGLITSGVFDYTGFDSLNTFA